MNINRRDFLKIISSSAALAVVPAPLKALELSKNCEKAPCRFCGVGCGVMVEVENGRIVGVTGDKLNPVNKGLLCIKGYSLPGILYGKDRLTSPMIRKNGKLEKASWEEALSLIASKFKENIDKHGPSSVAMYGSGQWTITDGYAALKWFKGGIGSNNVEANARLCMASAVTGFMTTFGSDEPMGCYEDFERCDAAVLWGNNMAEMHPVLFSRIMEHRRKNPHVKIVDIATRRTPTTKFSDLNVEFIPQSDLAIANGIAHLIIKRNQHDKNFIEENVVFKRGKENIGYGLKDHFKFKDKGEKLSFDEFALFLDYYTPEKVAEISGVPKEKISELADIYGNPKVKVLSLWCMGANQHTRGTWINNLIYNLHLLTGKICKPGSTPFSLTGQPSACGTVREVGTLAHRLPADMVVMNPKHRKLAADIWKIPVENIKTKPGYHTVEMFRALDRGDVKAMWIQVTNPLLTMPNLNRYKKAVLKEDRFIVVSDVYPTPTTEIADVVLPSAMWVEREGMFGNSERRTQHWKKLVEPPDGCMADDWQIIEVAKKMGFGNLFPYSKETYVKELYEEYRRFTLGTGKDLAEYDDLVRTRGMQWPVVNGKETPRRYVGGSDPYVKNGKELEFYKAKKNGKRAVIWARPYEKPPEMPDSEYPFWFCTGRVLEHWHSGSMTRRVPQLHKAFPEAYLEINPDDALALGIADSDFVKLVSKRGEVTIRCKFRGRGRVPKGTVFAQFFDESKLVNKVTLDAYDPISKQPDYKKCAVRVERV